MNAKSIVKRIFRNESGQVLPWVAILMMLLFAGLCSLVVDIGRGIVAYHMLQSATDAAVMAGAQVMPTAANDAAVTAQATLFSAVPGNNNARDSILPNASMVSGYPSFYCSSTVAGWGVLPNANLAQSGAVASSNVTACKTGANALVVAEQVTIPMYFASIIGFPNMTLYAQSTAAMRGTAREPYNVAIVVDTTASMNSSDGKTTDCGSLTRVKCSLQGVLELLGDLTPCAYGSTCGSGFSTSGNQVNVGSPFDEVALYTFPGLTSSANATNDVTCGGTKPSPALRSPVTPTPRYLPTSSSAFPRIMRIPIRALSHRLERNRAL